MLGIFNRKETAPVASARLKVLLAHERAIVGQTDLVAILRHEILAVIDRHVSVDPRHVKVRSDTRRLASRLRVDIEIPADAPLGAP